MYLGIPPNVHRTIRTYQRIYSNVFRLNSFDYTSPHPQCHFSVTQDTATVYKITLINLNLASRYTSKPIAYIDIISFYSSRSIITRPRAMQPQVKPFEFGPLPRIRPSDTQRDQSMDDEET